MVWEQELLAAGFEEEGGWHTGTVPMRVLAVVRDKPGLSAAEIATAIEVMRPSVYRDLRMWVRRGLVERRGEKRPWKWFPTEKEFGYPPRRAGNDFEMAILRLLKDSEMSAPEVAISLDAHYVGTHTRVKRLGARGLLKRRRREGRDSDTWKTTEKGTQRLFQLEQRLEERHSLTQHAAWYPLPVGKFTMGREEAEGFVREDNRCRVYRRREGWVPKRQVFNNAQKRWYWTNIRYKAFDDPVDAMEFVESRVPLGPPVVTDGLPE